MRKIINILLLAGIVISLSTGILAAYDYDIGYVIVRCTVTIDVDVLDDQATAWFVAKSTANCTLSPNQVDVSISSIAVKNNSQGAVLRYAVIVTTIQRTADGTTWVADGDDFTNGIKGWYVSTSTGNVGQCILAAVFASSRPAITEFGGGQYNDRFPGVIYSPTITDFNNHTYKTGGQNFDPVSSAIKYPSALGNTSGTNCISPVQHNPRGLWFYILTPAAVTDDMPRRFIITVYGALSGSSW